jgi:putative DNA primase/helicase
MTAHLRSWAAALGGDVSGRGVICPGPGHSARDRSLSVTPSATAPNGFLVNSFAGDDPIACRDHVRARLGLPKFCPKRPQKPAAGIHGGPSRYNDTGAPAKPPEPPQDNRARPMAIWSESRHPRGTLIEAYLGSRRLELPDEAANEAIRYHRDCPFGRRERFPAMICLVRNIVTNEPQGIHRTALMPDGTAVKRNGKTFRLSLGSMAGGAIKIDPNEDVTQGICIGEGLETCLAGQQMEPPLRPSWSLISTGGVTNFPVLRGIDGIHIFKELGQTSEKAVEACAARWHAAGRTVLIVMPEIGSDLNDELRAALQ